MSIVVKIGIVDDGKNFYRPGDIIPGLTETEEQELVTSGVCRFVEPEIEEEVAVAPEGDLDKEPKGDLDKEPVDDLEKTGADDGPNTGMPNAEQLTGKPGKAK